MGIFHDHTKAHPEALKDHVRVVAKEDFTAYINGIEPVRFVVGERHKRAFLKSEVAPWIKLGKFSQVLPAAAMAKLEAEEKAKKAKAAQEADEERLKLEAEEKAKASSGGTGGDKLPDEKALDAMVKEALISQAREEGVDFQEKDSKSSIVKAILAKRGA